MGCLKGGVVANTVVPTGEYVRFAAHHGFRPDFCQAADPESKGIVENLVGYAKADLMIPGLGGSGAPFPDLAIRDGNWKFLCMSDGSRPELYDLSTDLSESHNLTGAHSDRVTQMKNDLLKWNASMPKDRPDPPRQPNPAPKADG